MAGKCKFCGFVGTNDEIEEHAGNCPILDEDFQYKKVAPGSENICEGFKQCDISKFDVKSKHCEECIDDVHKACQQDLKNHENV